MESHVHVVDDDASVRAAYRQTLELDGYAVTEHAGAASLLADLDANYPGVVITDVRMPGMDGFDLMAKIQAIDSDVPVILATGHGDIPMAIRAMRKGVFDFIEKPADPDHLVEIVRRAEQNRSLILENRCLREQVNGAAKMIGHSRPMVDLRRKLALLADTNADVLINGETGTGKELAARALHDGGPRRLRNFVAINCGSIPETILESELFGHVQGAFTGAMTKRIGKIEHADGGTLFLDEIESMPLAAQTRLLRVLQERIIEPLGSNTPKPVDIRVVAATKIDLDDLCRSGGFRADLYYRLNVVSVHLPPLRDRQGDIEILYRHFLRMAAYRHARDTPELEPARLAELEQKTWHGNVRELQNVAERHVLGFEDPLSGNAPAGCTTNGSSDLRAMMDNFEYGLLADALKENSGHISETAQRLGISRKTLYLKLRKHGLSSGEEV